MHRSTPLTLATAVVAALAASPAAAQTTPSSDAGATAGQVDGVVTVSGTSASTGGAGAASSTVLGLGEETVVGGSQEGRGEQQGEVVSTGEDSERGYLTVGGWRTQVEQDRSYARSAVVDGNLGGEGGISGSVLRSESTAERERAEASTTGVVLDVGGGQLHLELLKATTTSDGPGHSAIVVLNGDAHLTSDDAGGRCEIPAEPILHLLCLYAHAVTGEDGSAIGGGAGVADATALDGNLTGRAFDARATAGPADEEPEAPEPAGGSDPVPAPDDPLGPLPRTGAGLLAGLFGLAAIGAGEGLRRFGRR